MSRRYQRILILLLLIPALPGLSQGTWERIPVPTMQYLMSVCFTDSLYGWVAGDSGIILHTTDGGDSWVRQNTGTTNEISEVFFYNRNLGWAAALNYTTSPYGTVLLKTTDGGATWAGQPYPVPNLFMTCILFRDPLNGWMGGRPHALVRTHDGGATWTQAAIDTSTLAFFPVMCIQFYNDKYGYASGGMFDIAGVTWHTSDGGNMWYAIDPSQAPADEVHSLHIFDSLHVMGAGGDPDFGYGVGMSRTSDGGWNWTYDELPIQGNAHDLDFRNDTEAWAPLGPKRKLIYSLDAGMTWSAVIAPDSAAIYDMTFPDSLHGYGVGKDGAVLRYIPPVVNGTGSPPGCPVTGFRADPNPVPGLTSFRFTLPAELAETRTPGRLSIRISDLAGRRVACIDAGTRKPGVQVVPFDAGGLPKGVYVARLEDEDGGGMGVAGVVRVVVW